MLGKKLFLKCSVLQGYNYVSLFPYLKFQPCSLSRDGGTKCSRREPGCLNLSNVLVRIESRLTLKGVHLA